MELVDLGAIRRVVPELIEDLQARVRILQRVRLVQPIGRRGLAQQMGLTERVLRSEVDVLRQQGLLSFTSAGMSLSEDGERLLGQLDSALASLDGRDELATAVTRILHIPQVVVVPGNSDDEAWVKQTLGQQAAMELTQRLVPEDVLAVTGGTTMAAVAQMLVSGSSQSGGTSASHNSGFHGAASRNSNLHGMGSTGSASQNNSGSTGSTSPTKSSPTNSDAHGSSSHNASASNAGRNQQRSLSSVKVVPARGGLGEDVALQSNTVASELAKRLGGSSIMLHVPDQLSQDTFQQLVQEPQIQQRLSEVRGATFVIHGIGDAMKMAKRRQMSEEEVKLLHENGAVAEAFGYYFDAEGNQIYSMTTVGLRLADINDIRVIMAVAGGHSKARAIVAAAKAYRIDVLVTDEGAAKQILQYYGGDHS